MADKFHIKPFDEGTLVKLELLKLYVKSWLHVFISTKKVFWKDIFIYDFFSGAGMDSKGKPGSPLVILNELRDHCPSIIQKGLKVRLLFNEPQLDVFDNLKRNVSDFFVGIVVFASINFVNTPPIVSIPNDSGVTSSKRTSFTSPVKTPPCIAAPTATTSSGFTPFEGFFPKNFSTTS